MNSCIQQQYVCMPAQKKVPVGGGLFWPKQITLIESMHECIIHDF